MLQLVVSLRDDCAECVTASRCHVDHVPIDKQGLIDFILKCQDPRGGLSDRPMDERDLYHTYFGIAGAIMLGYLDEQSRLVSLDSQQIFLPLTSILPMLCLYLLLNGWDSLQNCYIFVCWIPLFDLGSIPKAEHAMTITRKEIVVFPPFSKQDCECPFIYVGSYVGLLYRARSTGLCCSDRIRLCIV